MTEALIILAHIASLILAIGLHEYAHCLAFRRYGCRVETVNIGFFGLPIFRDKFGTRWLLSPFLLGGYASPADDDAYKALTPKQEAVIAVVGPAANLFLAFVYALVPYEGWGSLYVWAHLNFLLAAINLIPVPPLDGGRILFAGMRVAIGDIITKRIEAVAYPLGLLSIIVWQIASCVRND